MVKLDFFEEDGTVRTFVAGSLSELMKKIPDEVETSKEQEENVKVKVNGKLNYTRKVV